MAGDDVYTLEQVLADQEDLDTLCANRPLPTCEPNRTNAFYGHAMILKAYARLPPPYQLKMLMPHSVYLVDWPTVAKEWETPLPLNFIYPAHLIRAYAEETKRLTIPFSSPFLYLLKLLEGQPAPVRRGTLFFPTHSSVLNIAHIDVEHLADSLLQLEERFHPITVCMYWIDYLRGQHRPFQQRGLKIVSAGHRNDPFFLFRLYHLCSLHKYAASNEFGTTCFFSIASGCSFFFHNIDQPVSYSSPYNRITVGKRGADTTAKAKALFSTVCDPPNAEQKQFVDYFLGKDFLLSPAQLRKKLLAAEIFDKLGCFHYENGLLLRPAFPCFLQRWCSRYRLYLRRFGSRVKRLVLRGALGYLLNISG
jgi:hypothetical protein